MFSWTFDALTGFKPRRNRRPAAVSKPAVPAPTSGVVIDAHLSEMRSEALRRILPKLSSWYGSRRDARYIAEVNDFLSRAANITDLEQRIRIIERQRHFS